MTNKKLENILFFLVCLFPNSQSCSLVIVFENYSVEQSRVEQRREEKISATLFGFPFFRHTVLLQLEPQKKNINFSTTTSCSTCCRAVGCNKEDIVNFKRLLYYYLYLYFVFRHNGRAGRCSQCIFLVPYIKCMFTVSQYII